MITPPNCRFAVLLPMYNEEECAEKSVMRLINFFNAHHINAKIVAVNDGSKDHTAEILASLQQRYPNQLDVVTHTVNRGYGGGMRSGFAYAAEQNLDYLIVMDGDGTQDPIFLGNFFPLMNQGTPFIKASRYCKGGRVENVTWQRRLISYVGNRLAKLVLGLPINDYTNGFRAAHKSLFQTLTQTTERGFSVLMEEVKLAKRAGASFAEVPYTLIGRPVGSKFIYSRAVYQSYLRHLK